MNKFALILVGLTLGQTVPAVAHAQQRYGRDPADRQQLQDRPNRGDNARSQSQGQPQIDRSMPAPARLVSFNQVINQIQRSTPGRLLDATPPDPGSMRPVYRIRWQADSGQRIDYVVDAQSGAIVGRNGG